MKKRLDTVLVEKGLVTGRDKAKGYIMAGQVFVDHQMASKPGQEVEESSLVELRCNTLPYVSRGGLKLAKAITAFELDLTGCTCMDIGASTGGFTDCMLQNGAVKVYAIDVGYGQLAWKLRSDERVVVLERTNFRHVTGEQVPDPIDFASVDVSFISLSLVLPVAHQLLREGGEMVCLIKPQFEAGRDKVGKKGVVREISTHLEVVERITALAGTMGFRAAGLDYSPIKGPEGNIEYLLHLQKQVGDALVDGPMIQELVHQSHTELQEKQ